MTEHEIKTRFPRASRSFVDANLGVRTQKSKPITRPTLVDAASGETKSNGRIGLSYVLHRVRLLDPDNAVGATKTITDCLCQVGLIPGDSGSEIILNVTQEKVNHKEDERTVLTITYP